jgi:23S rRNA pseudouridine2605 synthase
MTLPPKSVDPETPRDGGNAPREGERIAKLLARAGVASRREVERLIEAGRVKLEGDIITTPATVLTSLRGITVDDQPVKAPQAARLFAFHKPAGLLTAERDPAGRPTIYTALRNAMPEGSPRVMPVGRLDLNTEGLLLLTNDGELKRAMELPSTGVPRTYRARTFGPVTQEQLEELMIGVEIEGVRYGSINANMERSTGANQWIELTLSEGKNREVRRVLEHLGLQVSRLIRIAYGPFHLGDLPRGAAVEIAQVQVERFRKGLKLADPASSQQAAFSVNEGKPAHRTPAAPAVEPQGERHVKRAPARRKPDPSRPDESLGRRSGPHAAPTPAPRGGRSDRGPGTERGSRAERGTGTGRGDRTERSPGAERSPGGEASSRYNRSGPRAGPGRGPGPAAGRGKKGPPKAPRT